MNEEKKPLKTTEKKSGIMEFLRYILTGCSVTAATLLLLWLFSKFMDYDIANALAGIIMVFVAFFPYKLFVFRSKSWQLSVAAKELGGFVSARIFTYLFDALFVMLFVRILSFNHSYPIVIERLTEQGSAAGGIFPLEFSIMEEWIVKFVSMVITTVLNYIFSKFVIFRKRKTKEEKETAAA